MRRLIEILMIIILLFAAAWLIVNGRGGMVWDNSVLRESEVRIDR